MLRTSKVFLYSELRDSLKRSASSMTTKDDICTILQRIFIDMVATRNLEKLEIFDQLQILQNQKNIKNIFYLGTKQSYKKVYK